MFAFAPLPFYLLVFRFFCFFSLLLYRRLYLRVCIMRSAAVAVPMSTYECCCCCCAYDLQRSPPWLLRASSPVSCSCCLASVDLLDSSDVLLLCYLFMFVFRSLFWFVLFPVPDTHYTSMFFFDVLLIVCFSVTVAQVYLFSREIVWCGKVYSQGRVSHDPVRLQVCLI